MSNPILGWPSGRTQSVTSDAVANQSNVNGASVTEALNALLADTATPDARVWEVGQGIGMYASIQAAITAINADPIPPSINNRCCVLVWPGKYTMTAQITVPEYVSIVGVSSYLVQLENATTDMFLCSGHQSFERLLIEGAANASLYAFDCNNKSGVHLREVNMLNNGGTALQKFLKQSGSTWATLFIERCIVDYYGTSGYPVLLENTSGAARFVDCYCEEFFVDAFQLSSAGGCINVKGCQDVRLHRSTLRGQVSNGTCVKLETGGATGTPWVWVDGHLRGFAIYSAAAGTVVQVANDFDGYRTPIDDGNSGTDKTLDFSATNFAATAAALDHKLTLTAACTLTFTAPPAGSTIRLELAQDGTGGWTVTWPATVKWPGGVPPTLSAAASAVDYFEFYYNGTSYYNTVYSGGLA